MTDDTNPSAPAGEPEPTPSFSTLPPPSPDTPPVAAPPPPPTLGQPASAVPPPPGAAYGAAYGPPIPPPAGPVQPTRARKGIGSRLVRIVIAIVVVIAIGIGYAAFRGHHLEASAPGAGSCVWVENASSSSSAKLHKVDCTDPKAAYKVLKKLTGTSDATQCESVTGTEAEYVGTFTSNGDTSGSVVLCLAATK